MLQEPGNHAVVLLASWMSGPPGPPQAWWIEGNRPEYTSTCYGR